MSAEAAFRHFTPFSDSGSRLLLEKSTNTSVGRVYKGVMIVKSGRGNKDDNNYYPAETLKEGVKTGIFEGLRAFADHPTAVDEQILPERSIRDMVGIYTKARFKEAGNGSGRVIADLTIFPHASWLTSTVDQLMALGQAEKIGISINGSGKTVPKKVSLSESGEPQEVNWLKSFHVLRSADIVTEAGAGGGFQRILESARAARGKTMKLTSDQQKKLSEATAKGDLTEVQRLTAEFMEANKNGGGSPKKETPAKKTALADPAVAGSEDEDPELKGEELEEADASDPDADLDAAVEEVKENADEEADADPDDDSEGDGDEDDDESDSGEATEEVKESDMSLKEHLLKGARAIRAHAARHPDAKKSLEESAKALEDAAKETSVSEAAKGGKKKKGVKASSGGNLTTTVKGGVSVPGQKTWKNAGAREAAKAKPGSPEERIAKLEESLGELQAQNKRLSSQLRARQDADRARKLLKESSIPDKMRPRVLKELVGLGERQMKERIEYHESLYDTLLESVRESSEDFEGDDYDPIEGAGTRTLREGGFSRKGDDFSEALFEEVGIPLKK